ncbi:MAG: type II secretion system GspH family protein [Lentisphaeraceae bacterium]|nr:type II secretion system GspH family protein [Lentisphaeraceae bacterium]
MRSIRKFSLLELLVVIAVLGILMSFLLPSLRQAKEKAKIAVCLSNMKQLYVFTNNFRANHNSAMPARSGDLGRFTETVEDNVPSINKSGLSVIPEIIQFARGYPAGRNFWSKKHKQDDFFCPSSVVEGQQPGGGDLRQTGYGYNNYAWRKLEEDELKRVYIDRLDAVDGSPLSEGILYSETAWYSTVKHYEGVRDEEYEEYLNVKWHYRLDHGWRGKSKTLNNMYFDGHMKTLTHWLDMEKMASTQWSFYHQN